MNEIKIQIGDKQHSFHFGMGAWEKFCELQGCEFDEMMQTGIFPISATATTDEVKHNPFVFKKLLYAGYLHQCEREEKEPELNKAQASDILDVIMQNADIRDKVYQLIANSIRIDDGSKKKAARVKG